MIRIEVTKRTANPGESGQSPTYETRTLLVQEFDVLDLPGLLAYLNHLAPEPCCARCGKAAREHPWGDGAWTGNAYYVDRPRHCDRFVTLQEAWQEARADRLEAELEQAFATFAVHLKGID